jgi:hypothetical protein
MNKSRSYAVFLAVVLVVGLLGVSVYSKRQRWQSRQTPPRENRLQWLLDQAKANGEKQVVLSAPTTEYLGDSASTTLDRALSNYTTVVATPTEVRSYVAENSEDIVTWVRFTIIESLSQAEKPACAGCDVPQPPEEFSKVGENEFVMSKVGGRVVVQGISVVMADPEFPEFSLGKKYLLFISRYPSGVALIGVGPKGVFAVDDEGKMGEINPKPHPIKTEVKQRLNDSLEKFEQRARLSTAKP